MHLGFSRLRLWRVLTSEMSRRVVYWRFGGMYCPHIQSRRLNQVINQQEACSKQILHAETSRIPFSMSLGFSVDLILSAALWPWGRLSLKQKWVPGVFLGVKSGRSLGLTTSSASMRRLCKQYGALTSKNPIGPQRNNFTFFMFCSMTPCSLVQIYRRFGGM
jgi:ribosomal protein L34E